LRKFYGGESASLDLEGAGRQSVDLMIEELE
jgi:hypothetical protein